MEEEGEAEMQFLSSGRACIMPFQLACLLSICRMSALKEKQRHNVLYSNIFM